MGAFESLRELAVITRADLGALFAALSRRGYAIKGPRRREHAIVYDDLSSADELPAGVGDDQGPGRYRLTQRADAACFGFASPQHSWRAFLHIPTHRLATVTRSAGGYEVTPADAPAAQAFIGVRACDLAAILVQDRTFLRSPYTDPDYAARRAASFIVAVPCTSAGGTCFCASMGTGPGLAQGFDLAMAELVGGTHELVLQAGSSRGAELLAELPTRPATEEHVARVRAGEAHAMATMGRRLDTTDIKGLLQGNLEHPRWDDVAGRCLACTNCTMACPTCFCTTVREVTDLTSTRVERWRRWDSCYTLCFSRLHGGSVRTSIRGMYRHWLVHKVASWFDQFGVSGCVGCGRCITWCPAGIDLTEEVSAIRAADGRVKEPRHAKP